MEKDLLQEGDVFQIQKTIYPSSFIRRKTLLAGTYITERTCFDGGTHNSSRDYYPDGHHVFVRRLIQGEYNLAVQIQDFYQTGCFSDMIKPEQYKKIGKWKKKITVNWEKVSE